MYLSRSQPLKKKNSCGCHVAAVKSISVSGSATHDTFGAVSFTGCRRAGRCPDRGPGPGAAGCVRSGEHAPLSLGPATPTSPWGTWGQVSRGMCRFLGSRDGSGPERVHVTRAVALPKVRIRLMIVGARRQKLLDDRIITGRPASSLSEESSHRDGQTISYSRRKARSPV